MEMVPAAVAQAAMDTGVARKPIVDMAAYREQLKGRLNPTTSVLTSVYETARANPKRVLFAEAEEEVVLRAAIAFKRGRLWHAGAGRPRRCARQAARAGRRRSRQLTSSTTAAARRSRPQMVERLYERLQRTRLSCAATSSGWSTAIATSSAR